MKQEGKEIQNNLKNNFKMLVINKDLYWIKWN